LICNLTEHAAVLPEPCPLAKGQGCGIVQVVVCSRQDNTNASISASDSQYSFYRDYTVDSNAIRRLREALGISQQELASLLNMSIGSIRAYERGAKPSEATMEQLKSMAARNMLPDIALDLDDRDFPAKRVFTPETNRVRLPANPTGSDLSDVLHNMLDLILESGKIEAITALEATLNLAKSYINSSASANAKAPAKKSGGQGK
jgi:DNA-binding transcriptional regulator YiaG